MWMTQSCSQLDSHDQHLLWDAGNIFIGLNETTFVNDVHCKMSGTLVVNFGSNYCRYYLYYFSWTVYSDINLWFTLAAIGVSKQ